MRDIEFPFIGYDTTVKNRQTAQRTKTALSRSDLSVHAQTLMPRYREFLVKIRRNREIKTSIAAIVQVHEH